MWRRDGEGAVALGIHHIYGGGHLIKSSIERQPQVGWSGIQSKSFTGVAPGTNMSLHLNNGGSTFSVIVANFSKTGA